MLEDKATVHQPLSAWRDDEKPREKLLRCGARELSDAELLAILLRTGVRGNNVFDLAQSMLSFADNNLDKLGNISVHQMCNKFKGIGKAKAIGIVAALELGRRRKIANPQDKMQYRSSDQLFQLFHPQVEGLDHEQVWVAFLSHSFRLQELLRISTGGTAASVFDVKRILRMAIERSSSAIAVCHNHPSGTLFPSSQDKHVTQKLADGCSMVDVKLIDHIIISGDEYYSMFDNNDI